MKNSIYITIANLFATLVRCKKEPVKFKIKGRVMDGAKGHGFKDLIFMMHAKFGTANLTKEDLGSFTTNDSRDFELMYDKM